jgi:hypothetical protein
MAPWKSSIKSVAGTWSAIEHVSSYEQGSPWELGTRELKSAASPVAVPASLCTAVEGGVMTDDRHCHSEDARKLNGSLGRGSGLASENRKQVIPDLCTEPH